MADYPIKINGIPLDESAQNEVLRLVREDPNLTLQSAFAKVFEARNEENREVVESTYRSTNKETRRG